MGLGRSLERQTGLGRHPVPIVRVYKLGLADPNTSTLVLLVVFLMGRLLDLLRLAFAQNVRVGQLRIHQLVAAIATKAKESLPPAPLLPIEV